MIGYKFLKYDDCNLACTRSELEATLRGCDTTTHWWGVYEANDLSQWVIMIEDTEEDKKNLTVDELSNLIDLPNLDDYKNVIV